MAVMTETRMLMGMLPKAKKNKDDAKKYYYSQSRKSIFDYNWNKYKGYVQEYNRILRNLKIIYEERCKKGV